MGVGLQANMAVKVEDPKSAVRTAVNSCLLALA